MGLTAKQRAYLFASGILKSRPGGNLPKGSMFGEYEGNRKNAGAQKGDDFLMKARGKKRQMIIDKIETKMREKGSTPRLKHSLSRVATGTKTRNWVFGKQGNE